MLMTLKTDNKGMLSSLCHKNQHNSLKTDKYMIAIPVHVCIHCSDSLHPIYLSVFRQLFVTPHAQRERGKVVGRGVHL